MIVIPDIHGRDFWREAVKGNEEEEMVFLGDYVDPYSYYEDVPEWEGMVALAEVIDFKKKHPANVTLLLGNHDLSYLSPLVAADRHDDENHDIIKSLLKKNLDMFDIVHEREIDGRRFIFSHAGILPAWLEANKDVVGDMTLEKGVGRLNELFHAGVLYKALGNVSAYRGGPDEAGSIVWADLNEHMDLLSKNNGVNDNIFQVFGHTLQSLGRPLVMSTFACVDCKRAFMLNTSGEVEV